MIAALALSAGVSLTAGTLIEAGYQDIGGGGNSGWEGIGIEGGAQLRFESVVLGVRAGFVPALYGQDIGFNKRLTRADLSTLLSGMFRFGGDTDAVEHRLGVGFSLTGSYDVSGTGPEKYYYYQTKPLGRAGPALGYELSVRAGDTYRIAAALWFAALPLSKSGHTFLGFYSGSLRIAVEVPL